MEQTAKCKICRRAGEKLFLRGERCFTPKCAMERKPYTPGIVQNQRKHRSMQTEYGTQLREKQKVRNVYCLSEKQFAKYVKDATSRKGVNPAERLYENLETRLDSVVFRLGLADSRAHARQIATHGHVTVNGRRIDVPSYKVKKGDILQVREGSKTNTLFTSRTEKIKKHKFPTWVSFDSGKLEATVKGVPVLDRNEFTFNLTSVIEFYSR